MANQSATWKHAQTLESEHWLSNREAILSPGYRTYIRERSAHVRERMRPFGPVAGANLAALEIGGAGTPLVDSFECGTRHAIDPLANLYQREFASVLDHGVQWHAGKAEELPFPDASFDILISRNVLDHVEDDMRCLSEFRRVLKPAGIAYIAVNNFSGPLFVFRSIFKDPEHPYTYNHGMLDRRIRASGFKVLDSRKDPAEHMSHFNEMGSQETWRKAVRGIMLSFHCYHYSEWILGKS